MGEKQPRCVVLGGGGHAAVVIEALLESRLGTPEVVLDRDPSRWGQNILGVPIAGGDEILPDLPGRGINCFVIGVGSTGDNESRARLFEAALGHGLMPLTIRHPTATCSASAQVGQGSVLLAGSIVGARAVLGVNVIVNSGAIVEHDCIIGDHVHVASGATIASMVEVGTGAHVGAGATVRQCLRIGARAVVGAGAVVVKEVRPGDVVVGVPARSMAVRQR